jgi:hypothetical protein
MTVAMTMTRVVENMMRLSGVEVLRIARAKAIAPRRPAKKNRTVKTIDGKKGKRIPANIIMC